MTGPMRRHQRRAVIAFIAPALLMFTIYVVYPILDSFWISLHRWDGINRADAEFIWFENYYELFFLDYDFTIALWNNIKWLVFFLFAPVFGLALALFLNQTIFAMRLIKSLFFFPFVISQVVVGLVFTWFYDPANGLLNEVLGLFGAGPISPLSQENGVTFWIIVAGLWPQTAYCMILYLTGLNNISSEQIEAARIDGAKGWKMFWHVVLPQLRPVTFLAVVVTVIGALRSFDLISVMTNGGPFGSSTVLAFKMYEESIFNYRAGYGAAVATVLFAIMAIYIAFFLQRMLRTERRGG